MIKGIIAMGNILATDIDVDGTETDKEIFENYNRAIQSVRSLTQAFLSKYLEDLYELDIESVREFATAVIAILGECKLAYLLFLSGWHSCDLVCPNCGQVDESIEFKPGEHFKTVERAKLLSSKWDGRSFDDTHQWTVNLLQPVGDEAGIKLLSNYLGYYTWPECKAKNLMLTCMEKYYF